jgi:hypothetical protein
LAVKSIQIEIPGPTLHQKFGGQIMKPEKQKQPDALEIELERFIRKLDDEKQALEKILKDSSRKKLKQK